MPDAPAVPAAPSPVPRLSITGLPFARQAMFWGFAALLLLGIAFYLWWGLSFGVWHDNGVYAVVVSLVGFGLAGMWLALPTPDRPIPAEIR